MSDHGVQSNSVTLTARTLCKLRGGIRDNKIPNIT